MKSIFLDTNHLFLRNPSGGVEDVASMKAAGFGAIFCNVGDFQPDEWDTVRHQAAMAGVVCGPWLRTVTPTGMFSVDKLKFLITVADAWDSPLIVNSESELKGSGQELTRLIANAVGKRDAGISMEGWPFSDVEWWLLSDYPMLAQIFPQESGAGEHPEQCKSQWQAYGMKCTVLTFGSYHEIDPNTFDRLTPYGVYTADDCNGNFQAWAPRGLGEPCLGVMPPDTMPPEEIMAKIGTSHGITAFVDWLQKQPGVPTAHGPDYNKDNPATWPWPERLERTLNMLREDHDKRVPV
jgi:hypothetical protein